jgi:tetratricopeptide (TPR) repeat protein
MVVAGEPIREGPLAGCRVGFVGRLGGVTRRDAMQLVRRHGGVPVDLHEGSANLVVIGADELPVSDDALLDPETCRAADEGRLEIITETQLWERLGLLEEGLPARRLYTPAMLAGLLRVPVATIRRWQRRGLIVPAKVVHRLPYFDFQEVSTARQLAQLLAAGISPAALEKKLASLSRYLPGAERPLAQLSVIVEGREILLRQDEGLIEPSGLLRFDFEALEREAREQSDEAGEPTSVSYSGTENALADVESPDHYLRAAQECEDRGQLPLAAELCRSALAMGGPRADACFQLAELLYRLGDVTAARERYYMAIELDEEFVEARSNLGCVLAECGELELAVAAFQGALSLYPDYADAHYHLARTLGELGQRAESEAHWRDFLRLAPDSPWADEARQWLDLEPPDTLVVAEASIECPE